MKSVKFITIILLLAMLGYACSKGNTMHGSLTTTDPIVGSWKVSSFSKEAVDLTGQFSNYTISCSANGAMTIQGNANTSNCNWSNMSNNHSMYNFHMMGHEANSVLWEFSDDWDLINHDTTHCYFSSRNTSHHKTMTWIKKN